jgi:hypothetical protein
LSINCLFLKHVFFNNTLSGFLRIWNTVDF